MHLSSYLKMEWFKNKYLAGREAEELNILDIGSLDMGGSYKALFCETAWNYTGIDLVPGAGVDIVVRDCYKWSEIETSAYDVVISGQAFEHMPYFWLVMQEIARVMKPDGICCIIAPGAGPEHRCPVDCYRFYPDGMIAMAEYVHMNVLHAFMGEGAKEPERDIFRDNDGIWQDCVLIAQKGKRYSAWQDEGRRKAVVWGTGTLAAKLWNRIPVLDIEPVMFVDNDKTKCGGFFRGIRVATPEELCRMNYDLIIICSHYIQEIKEQLLHEMQADAGKIVTYEDFI